MNSIKRFSRDTIGKLERRAGRLKENRSGWSTDDPRFGYTTLISSRELNAIQDPESGYEGLGESESYPTSA